MKQLRMELDKEHNQLENVQRKLQGTLLDTEDSDVALQLLF